MTTGQVGAESPFSAETLPVNQQGGTAPPGYGAHSAEILFWSEPQYRVHPLTGRLEAVGGIFHRLWPENVHKLIQMKLDGWYHTDIVEVAKVLWKRQQDDYQQKESVIEQVKQQKQQAMQQDIQNVHNPNIQAPPPNMLPGAGGPPAMGGPPGMGGGPIVRSLVATWVPPFKVILAKADTTGGERALSPQEEKIKDEQSFTRKEMGVANSAFTSGPEQRHKIPGPMQPIIAATKPPKSTSVVELANQPQLLQPKF